MRDPQDAIRHNKDVYNIIAKQFAATRSFLWDNVKIMIEDIQPGERILDLGCGHGQLYGALKEKNISYTGVDQSEKQIESAKKEFPEGDFRLAEMSVLPFIDQEFDRIYCIAAFHHLPPQWREMAAKEMARVLKAEGTLYLTNWNLRSSWALAKLQSGDWHRVHDAIFVPWKNEKGEVMGERIYYDLSSDDIANIFTPLGFRPRTQYYSKRKVPNGANEGDNLVSILIR